jgi:hypothetical protein
MEEPVFQLERLVTALSIAALVGCNEVPCPRTGASLDDGGPAAEDGTGGTGGGTDAIGAWNGDDGSGPPPSAGDSGPGGSPAADGAPGANPPSADSSPGGKSPPADSTPGGKSPPADSTPGSKPPPKPAGCGDGLCGKGEDCVSCKADCGACCTGGLCVFPGAEGFGVTTKAGRGGKVIRVTNLNASGAGSLRAAVEASGARTIIFDVGGTIKLTSDISVKNPFLTIAGQTAPSPGITVRGAGLVVRTSDVLVQHLRIRVGDDPSGPSCDSRDGIRLYTSAKDVVIDHVSVSWAVDENTSTYGTNLTFSNCIISEALANSCHSKGKHSKGMLVMGGTKNLAVVRNLFAHNVDRNPHMNSSTDTVLVNNLVYNPVDDAFGDEWGSPTDVITTIIGNAQIDGPSTTSSTFFDFSRLKSGCKAYQKDNTGDQKVIATGSAVVSSPPLMYAPAALLSSAAVKAHVLANAGARPLDRDAVDKRVVGEVQSKGGKIIDSPGDVGGWPKLQQSTRTLTLPPNPNGDDDNDGYTNLEEWLHELAHKVGG